MPSRSELFFLHTTLIPDDLRIHLSPALQPASELAYLRAAAMPAPSPSHQRPDGA